MTFINWVMDTFARLDIIDTDFIVSDLVDIPISEVEQYEIAYFDTMASNGNCGSIGNPDVPVGKQQG